MAGSDEHRDRLFAGGAIGHFIRERPDPAAPGKRQRGRDRAFAGNLQRVLAILALDSCRPQGHADAARAIAAPAERRGALPGKKPVVDIAKLRHPADERRRIGRVGARPFRAIQLAQQIIAQFRARRRVTADITERERLQPRGIQGTAAAPLRRTFI